MNKLTVKQYLHRPNVTELGMGNTHETYLLVSKDTDISDMFPLQTEVEVEDSETHKIYILKSTGGDEFRLNKMGEFYRDNNLFPGDEVLFTQLKSYDFSKIYITAKKYNRVVFSVKKGLSEIFNLERLSDYIKDDNTYRINLVNRGISNTLVIKFNSSKPKRKDSPTTTDFYEIYIDENLLPDGTHYLNLSEKSFIETLNKSRCDETCIDQNLLHSIQPKHKSSGSNSNPSSIYNSYLAAIKTKPFMLLAGISGTGKSRIVRKLAQATVTYQLQKEFDPSLKEEDFENNRWELHKPANFEIIQVKPNWHNSMDVVGYLSNIPEPHYVFTPFVHFIIEAFKHPEVPYFLCLDEMNLAPVEEYFAEFLSAIESRSVENGKYVTDPVIKPFKEFGDVAGDMLNELFKDSNIAKTGDVVSVGNKKEYKKEDDSTDATAGMTEEEKKVVAIQKHLLEKGLTLPANLIVIGTVNMDETTFSFSRKVLDRAMSFEMNDVHYDNFLEGTTDDELKNIVDNIGKDDLNKYLIERVVDGRNVSSVDDEDSNKVIDYLDAVNKLLDGTQFKLGYRAANEALIYLDSCKKIGCTDVNKVLDDFTLMKILSRFEGDESKLQLNDSKVDEMQYIVPLKKGISLLEALKELMTKMLGNSQYTDEKKENAEGDNTPQEGNKQNQDKFELASAKKADEMQQILERDRFVSFWN